MKSRTLILALAMCAMVALTTVFLAPAAQRAEASAAPARKAVDTGLDHAALSLPEVAFVVGAPISTVNSATAQRLIGRAP